MSATDGDPDAVYQTSPGVAPDSEFEPGGLKLLVAGNRGRLLDARRTPVSVVEVRSETGFVLVRIEGFEDTGAIWEVPLEGAHHYQFDRDSQRATEQAVDEMRQAIERYDRELVIEPAEADGRRSEERIAELQADAATWLAQHSRFLATGRSLPDPGLRRGDELLADDLERYMRERRCWDVESTFATRFVSNPGSGETVKGHRIVLATLGLAAYVGTVVRDAATFSDSWSRERRGAHILTRLAFLRALFAILDIEHVPLWRGLSGEMPLRTGERRTFVSASFSETVARSHFETGAERPTRVLQRQSVPVDRLFMSYLETGAMNRQFLEAEAVLLARPDDGWP